MTYGFENEADAVFDFDAENVYHAAVNAVLDEENCPYEACVDLIITTDDEIRRINKEQRGIDSPTDVLSFPMVSYEIPADFSHVEETPGCFDPDTGELLLGDMMISSERIRSQAAEYGHSTLREFAFLIVHSMLHLIGYDHIEEEDRSLMEEKQKTIMGTLNILR
ncbi:MAG: rRNA maturation RNase YbeY [Lachnospiraceae bacterium]|nr:rRNA maturation RNase YbeY [Lachnospiraceae bacterium]